MRNVLIKATQARETQRYYSKAME